MERLDWSRAIELFAQVDQAYLDKCREVTALREQLVKKWIPVEERLPETGEPVLVALGDSSVTVGVWHGHIWSSSHGYGEPVVAWMPLPEPYRPGN